MFKQVTSDQAALILEQMSAVFTLDSGPTISSAGNHADLGDIVIFNNAIDSILSIDPALEDDFNTWKASQ